MTLTYWRMREVDGLLWHQPSAAMEVARFAAAIGGQVLLTTEPGPGPTFAEFKAAHRVVWRSHDRDVVWVAPWWLAWLYRLLPSQLSWLAGPAYDPERLAPFYLWVVRAPTYFLAWMPARRRPQAGARLGFLRVGDRVLTV